MSLIIAKKTALANNLKSEFVREDENFHPYHQKSSKTTDYKAEIESKFREQKAIS